MMIAKCCICGFSGAVEDLHYIQSGGYEDGRRRKSAIDPEFWICDICYVNKIV